MLQQLAERGASFFLAGLRSKQKKTILSRARKICCVENRVVEARQPAGPQECGEASLCCGQNADFERNEEENRPAIERPSARVERLVDHRAVPLQKIEESGHRETTNQH
jgi:hypothetical protein